VPPVFRWLAGRGPVAEREMLRAFNCGVGMIVVVAASAADAVAANLRASGETVTTIGAIEAHGSANNGGGVIYKGRLDLGGG
jgi:phosphoribosylformylglycinamidine cyclo-ligase